ncbi:MAG TPA: dienelactone hydrolase family protein [Caulobacteraceae bacterium]|nr:dienelactone hydrolase family protein [Caulobacteraceae bacterium]
MATKDLPKLDGPRVPPATGAAATALVILLHGYGSNGADLIGLVPYWRSVLPGTLFVAPNAPEPVPLAPGGFQWWGFGGGPAERGEGVRRAVGALEAFIDEELAKAGLTEDRLALVGFSQGTMLALAAGPRRTRPIAGILGYSGRLADESLLDVATRPPVLLLHGGADEMIPVAAFHETRAALERLGFEVEGQVNPILGHSIDAGGVSLGARFLARVLGGSA